MDVSLVHRLTSGEGAALLSSLPPYDEQASTVLGARLIAVDGRLQSQSGVIHIVAERLLDLTPLLGLLSADAGDLEALANADEVKRPQADMREKIKPASRLQRLVAEVPALKEDFAALADATRKVMPKGRNFQ